MGISFEETTRGTGMVFMRVKTTGFGDKVTFSATNTTSDGKQLPVEFYPIERFGDYVVAFPVFDIPQYIRVTATNSQGAEVGQARKIVNPHIAKLNSQLNTALKNPAALYIRNSNRRARAQSTAIHVVDIIQGTSQHSIIRGRISIFSTSALALDAPVQLQVLGSNAEPVSVGEVTIMGDEIVEDDEFPGAFSRTIQYSVPISDKCPSFVLWATSNEDSISDGFLCLESHVVRSYKNIWHQATLSADRDSRYEQWFLENHRSSVRDFELQRMRRFEVRPLYSIIVPLYKTPINYFHDMLDSVLNQTYGRFELILVNASPEDRRLSTAVREARHKDKRVKVVNLESNLGITLNTNEGIKVASGDFVAFFDHDDVLEPDILYWYTLGINKHKDTDLLYCDEDKLIDGHFVSPHFKPDWNPDLLTARNYVCHMLTVRKSILDTLELPGKEYDGAQDYHMTFRVSEKARNIYHVRRVLYHWRIHSGSTAASAKAKSYTSDASILALQGHLDRTGIAGTAMPTDIPNVCRIKYELPDQPTVAIVIPNKDMVQQLDACINSIEKKSTYKNYRITIIENNSTEPETFAYYKRLKKEDRADVITVQMHGKFNFSRVINEGFRGVGCEYILMLNNDTEVIAPDWLQALLGPLTRKDVGAVGAKLLFPDGTIQHGGVAINGAAPCHLGYSLPGDSTDYFDYLALPQDLSAVTGACLLTKRSVFEEVGGMNEDFASDYNDVDFCLKIRKANYRIVYAPDALLTHYESVSRDMSDSGRRRTLRAIETGRLMQSWPSYWGEGDPCLSPNFLPGSCYRQLGF